MYVYIFVYARMCVVGWVGLQSFFRHDRAITRPSETQCGSFHVGLSNTSNCAVKPLFSVLLRKVCQLAESERRRGAREGVRGKEIRRERCYHGGVIKEENLDERCCAVHWHLASL